MEPRPLVSVIVPSYNQGRFIRETLESILSQAYRPIEVLVIDGASSDETLEVLRSFEGAPELRWWSEPDSGVVEAVNKGLARASGVFAAIQSSDDTYLRGAMDHAVAGLESDEGVGLVYGDVVKVDASGREISRTQLPAFTLEHFLACLTWIPQPAAFFRLDLARTLGGWRDEVPYAADTDLWLRMAFRTGVRKLDHVLAKRRMHEAQRDRQGARVIRDYARMIDTSEEIRRASGRLRRAAAAGKLIVANRYDYGASPWVRWWRLCRAVMHYPHLIESTPLSALVPGWRPVPGAAARLKKRSPRRSSLRERLGVVLLDFPRLLPRLLARRGWVRYSNRQDRVEISPDRLGVRCLGPWSSDLHACSVYPSLGRLLFRAALREWPIRFDRVVADAAEPAISFVICHRGVERAPLLWATVASILAQRAVAVECIVVEQSAGRELSGLPEGVRHIHLPHPSDPVGWRKSWAFNVGVSAARAPVVVCHDGDILVPCDYAREILARLGEDGDVAHLQRFLFCLGAVATSHLAGTRTMDGHGLQPERVRQNWQGGTLAIRKEAFLAIGGYDEEFVGWGGEDNEFYDRCLSLRGWRHGYLPFVHLWHPPQAEKESPAVREVREQLLAQKLESAREVRIRDARERQRAGDADA